MGLLEDRITLTAKMFANIKDEQGTSQKEVNSDIQIIFEEDVCPKTDGHRIYLPTNMNEERLWELLGALLHECLHIRFTDMKSVDKKFHQDPSLFHVLNCLEDIRINWKALQIFPKTKLFFHALYYYLAKSKKEELLAEPMTFQIIKTLLLSNEDFPLYSTKAQELMAKHDVWRFREIARNATSVKKLEKPAIELYELLKKINGDELSGMGDSELSNFLKQLKENMEKKLKEFTDENMDLQQQLNKLQDELDNLRKEGKRLHRKMATNKTRSKNLNSEADDIDSEADREANAGNSQKAGELRDKANHKRNLSDAAGYRGTEAENDLSDTEQKRIEAQTKIDFLKKLIQALKKAISENREMLEDLLKNGTESKAVSFGYSPLPLNGLDALKKNDLCYKHEYKLPKTLEDTIREVFLKKKEDREIEDEGNRMNRSNLYRIVTDNQRLFETNVQPYDKTKISFLLDMSGSMHGRRAELVNTAFAYLYNSLMEVLIGEQYEVEIGVFGFEYGLTVLKDFEEQKNGEQALANYRPCGGTRILENLNKIITKMQEDGQNEKRIVILLTDAEVGSFELEKIKNSVSMEDTKVVFIGIECGWSTLNNKAAKELFMDNIKSDSNVVEILTNALIRSL